MILPRVLLVTGAVVLVIQQVGGQSGCVIVSNRCCLNNGPSVPDTCCSPPPLVPEIDNPLCGAGTIACAWPGGFFPADCPPVTAQPTPTPSDAPTHTPTDLPTSAPSDAPTPMPTDSPTSAPSDAPTLMPTDSPTSAPSDAPTPMPTDSPTSAQSDAPTPMPTDSLTSAQSDAPTSAPTPAPTQRRGAPSAAPLVAGTTAVLCCAFTLLVLLALLRAQRQAQMEAQGNAGDIALQVLGVQPAPGQVAGNNAAAAQAAVVRGDTHLERSDSSRRKRHRKRRSSTSQHGGDVAVQPSAKYDLLPETQPGGVSEYGTASDNTAFRAPVAGVSGQNYGVLRPDSGGATTTTTAPYGTVTQAVEPSQYDAAGSSIAPGSAGVVYSSGSAILTSANPYQPTTTVQYMAAPGSSDVVMVTAGIAPAASAGGPETFLPGAAR